LHKMSCSIKRNEKTKQITEINRTNFNSFEVEALHYLHCYKKGM
jgi:hypothetical protein